MKKTAHRTWLTLAAGVLLLPAAVAQRPMSGAYAESAAGLPFVAEFIESNVPPPEKENRGSLATHGTIARDSAGRSMRVTENDRDQAHVRYGWINDPVSRTTIQWDSRTMTATMTHYLQPNESQKLTGNYHKTLPTPGICFGRPHTDLGKRLFDGIEAVGCTVPSEIKAGTVGNTQAFTQTTEDWTLTTLNLEAKIVTTDPYSGVRTWELSHIATTEPIPTLFQAPAGYTVREVNIPADVAAGTPDVPPPPMALIGGNVSAPVVVFAPEPNIPEGARRLKRNGNVIVFLQVDVNGLPTHVRVVRGIGHGCDEMAVEAVKKYKLKPAMEDGHPVSVDMNVSINFQLR